jgi:hypothetical protein
MATAPSSFLQTRNPAPRCLITRQAKDLFDEALKQDVKYIIFSSLPHTSQISNGKPQLVHHFE